MEVKEVSTTYNDLREIKGRFYYMNPNAGGNPFLKIIEQAKLNQGQPQGGAPMGGMGAGMNLNPDEASQAPTDPSAEMAPQPSITDVGQSGDQTTRPLIQALNALNTFVGASGDRQEIALAKTMLQLLSRMIQRNQAMGLKGMEEQPAQAATGQGQPMG